MTREMGAGAVIYAKDVTRVARFYSAVAGLSAVDREEERIVLESRTFQLVIVRVPEDIAATIDIGDPPLRRANAAVKLVFFVSSVADVRGKIASIGGAMNPPEKEWSFNGWTVCDGTDPEGNVIQFRERS